MNYIINRLKEKSTWIGIITLLGSLGVVIRPELREALPIFGVGLGALLAVIVEREG